MVCAIDIAHAVFATSKNMMKGVGIRHENVAARKDDAVYIAVLFAMNRI